MRCGFNYSGEMGGAQNEYSSLDRAAALFVFAATFAFTRPSLVANLAYRVLNSMSRDDGAFLNQQLTSEWSRLQLEPLGR